MWKDYFIRHVDFAYRYWVKWQKLQITLAKQIWNIPFDLVQSPCHKIQQQLHKDAGDDDVWEDVGGDGVGGEDVGGEGVAGVDDVMERSKRPAATAGT